MDLDRTRSEICLRNRGLSMQGQEGRERQEGQEGQERSLPATPACPAFGRQKSNWTVNCAVRAMRTGSTLPVGVNHAPPGVNAWFGSRMVSKFSALYKSSATFALVLPSFKSFPTRKLS